MLRSHVSHSCKEIYYYSISGLQTLLVKRRKRVNGEGRVLDGRFERKTVLVHTYHRWSAVLEKVKLMHPFRKLKIQKFWVGLFPEIFSPLLIGATEFNAVCIV